MLDELGQNRFMVSGPNSKEPTPQDLRTLDSFIVWLAKNNIRDPNGITLAWGPMPEGSQIAANTIAYKTDTGTYQITSVDGIIKALQELEQTAKASNNLFLQELISNLISTATDSDKLKIPATSFSKEQQQPGLQQPTTQQGLQQPATQQEGAQAVSYKETTETNQQNVIQKILGPEGIVWPFDIDQDQINVHTMLEFIGNIGQLIRVPKFSNELQYQLEMLVSAANNASIAAQAWQTAATPAANAGFDLGDIYNIEPFVSTYANNDYAVARNMMYKMITLCNSIISILGILRASPSVMNVAGRRILEQLEQGKAFIDKMQNMAARFQNAMKQ